MSYSGQDIYDMVDRIRYDLTAAQAKITDLKNALNTLALPQERDLFECPRCGINRRTQQQLADHLANVHDEMPADP